MNSAIKEALEIIMGGKSGGYYIAGFFFSMLGILISLYHSSKKRDPLSPNTPERFSWLFLIWDNCKRGGVTLIVMFILFRGFNLSEFWLMISVGVVVALLLDKVIEAIMARSEIICKLLGMNRDKFPQKP
jgi:hypothetical protein